MSTGDPIQGLWIGPVLSVMERLSIASFLAHGHQYHLYVYDDVRDVPAGAVVKDASLILPATTIFQYRNHKSYAGFSNFFRYRLLLEHGGWWADTDIVCLKPFDCRDEYVFSSEVGRDGKTLINAGVMKAPPGSAAMAYAWEICERKDTDKLIWGETGPKLVDETVRAFSLETYVRRPSVFCPVPLVEFERLVEAGASWAFDNETRSVHLWHEAWRRIGLDKNAQYDEDCLYEQLKRRFL